VHHQEIAHAGLGEDEEPIIGRNRGDEEGVASDNTGFSPGQASLYYQSRRGCLYQRWAKLDVPGIVPSKASPGSKDNRSLAVLWEPIEITLENNP
jgi:hypothetical protein